MGRLCEMMSGPGQVTAAHLPLPHENTRDFRTMLKQFLLDPVLPLLTLCLMAALTTAILTLMVTAVADMEQGLQTGSLSDEPWSAMASNPPAGNQAYADYAAAMAQMQARELSLDGPADAAYVVREQPGR